MASLTWNDLLIERVAPELARSCVDPWRALLGGRLALLFMNRFGFLFLMRPEGHIEMLDVFTGAVVHIADSREAMPGLVNDPEWHGAYLQSGLITRLHEAKIIPGDNQCYALAPHPAMGGPNPMFGDEVETRFVTVMDAAVWQSVCAQALGFGR